MAGTVICHQRLPDDASRQTPPLPNRPDGNHRALDRHRGKSHGPTPSTAFCLFRVSMGQYCTAGASRYTKIPVFAYANCAIPDGRLNIQKPNIEERNNSFQIWGRPLRLCSSAPRSVHFEEMENMSRWLVGASSLGPSGSRPLLVPISGGLTPRCLRPRARSFAAPTKAQTFRRGHDQHPLAAAGGAR